MLFEWDELKRQENIKERGVDFITAAQIFANDLIAEAVDTRKDYGEIRIRARHGGRWLLSGHLHLARRTSPHHQCSQGE